MRHTRRSTNHSHPFPRARRSLRWASCGHMRTGNTDVSKGTRCLLGLPQLGSRSPPPPSRHRNHQSRNRVFERDRYMCVYNICNCSKNFELCDGHSGRGYFRHKLARPRVGLVDVLERGVEHEVVLVLCARLFDDGKDVKVPNLFVEEHRHRLLVCGAEDARHRAAGAARGVAHRERRVFFHVGLLEGEVAHLDEVEHRPRLRARLHAIGPGEGVEDGEAHVGPAELCEHGGVGGLHHGVDDGLRVDDDVDVVIGGAVEVVRLDHLERFVHERGGVARNLGAHVPVRVRRRFCVQRERVLLGHLLHLLEREVTECAAGGCEDDLAEPVLGQALEALEDGGVFRVGGEDEDAVLLDERHDARPARDERLLIREADVLLRLDGGHRRLEPCAANDARDCRVRVRMPRHLDRSLLPRHNLWHLAVPTRERLLELANLRGVADAHERRAELLDLIREKRDVAPRAQRHNLKLVGMLSGNV
mmetsp:Transcript_7701/g.25525  ORF Transcript_7701/g.25525 Transcript_7701/m.25525 type:complete len:476 (-) Transcript_7701:266-1693(-)